jgi:hypothetical protein
MEMVTNIDATWHQIPIVYEDDKGASWEGFYTRVYNTDYLQLLVIVSDPDGLEHSYRLDWNGATFTRSGREVFKRLPKVTQWLVEQLPDPLEVEPVVGGLIYYRAVLRPGIWGQGEELGGYDGVDWLLAERLNPSTNFRYFVLYTLEKVPLHAAYHLMWNGEILADTYQSHALEKYRPDLYDAVIERLQEISE